MREGQQKQPADEYCSCATFSTTHLPFQRLVRSFLYSLHHHHDDPHHLLHLFLEGTNDIRTNSSTLFRTSISSDVEGKFVQGSSSWLAPASLVVEYLDAWSLGHDSLSMIEQLVFVIHLFIRLSFLLSLSLYFLPSLQLPPALEIMWHSICHWSCLLPLHHHHQPCVKGVGHWTK